MSRLDLKLKFYKPIEEREIGKYKYIDFIKIEELHEFTVEMLNEFGSENLLEEANKVADILIELLKKKKLLTNNSHQSFIDILLTATLLHNLFYNESNKDDWMMLFETRKILEPIAKEKGIVQQVTDAIFQTIEAQLGEDTPIPNVRPPANSPTELFAYAVWFAKEYKPQV